MLPNPDLIAAIERDKVAAARAMAPADKFFAGPRLFEQARRLMVEGVRNEFPAVAEEEVQRIVSERLARLRRLENGP